MDSGFQKHINSERISFMKSLDMSLKIYYSILEDIKNRCWKVVCGESKENILELMHNKKMIEEWIKQNNNIYKAIRDEIIIC